MCFRSARRRLNEIQDSTSAGALGHHFRQYRKILAAIYKTAWLLLAAVVVGVSMRSVFDVADFLTVPAYLVSAAVAWKWPWIAETVASLSLAVILMRFHPWIVSPFQRGLAVDFVFILAANVLFFTAVLPRRFESHAAVDTEPA